MKSISTDTKPAILTKQEYDEIIEAMPSGMAGFLKTWGLEQFAAAVEDKLVNKLTVQDIVNYIRRNIEHG